METKLIKPLQQLPVPVLLMVFNRLETSRVVFEEIKKARPEKLYVACDGPRKERIGESEKVCTVREYIIKNIDWPCSVQTLFRNENLGCKTAVSGAISWFFENEEKGIILEDDTVPNQSFFNFCAELLEKYEDDHQIWHIGGINFHNGKIWGDGSYYLSAFAHIWGWASWRRAWSKYRAEVSKEDIVSALDFLGLLRMPQRTIEYFAEKFEMTRQGKINTWDYQWNIAMWKHQKFAILPNVNLVTNIGYGMAEATHTSQTNEIAFLANHEIPKLVHPVKLKHQKLADRQISKKYFYSFSLLRRVFQKFKKLVRVVLSAFGKI
ncbi:MAG: nucleotide-diphospho-sugar transferase [Candidatus Riflebacteria bacterium]|nr:nucleotide-diphospho-sugar transferase [Candidatus Riflebacteria bacterium]